MVSNSFRQLIVALIVAAPACSQAASDGRALAAADVVRFDTLLGQLRDRSPERRRQAAATLSESGPRLPDRVQALITALGDTNTQVGFTAAWALGRLGAASVPSLVGTLADHHAIVRYRAAWALGKVGPPAAAAVPAVQVAMTDPDRSVRDVAAWALKQINRKAEMFELGSNEDLVAGLAARDPLDRLAAVARFQPYAGDAARAVPFLVRALGDGDPRVRGAAASALASLGPPGRDALHAALSDPNPLVRQEASVAMVRLGGALR